MKRKEHEAIWQQMDDRLEKLIAHYEHYHNKEYAQGMRRFLLATADEWSIPSGVIAAYCLGVAKGANLPKVDRKRLAY